MRKSTANAIKTLLRMDATVTPDVRMAVLSAMDGATALPDPTQDMTISEAAEYLGLGRVTVWRMCLDGRLAADRRGKKFYVKAAALKAMRREVA